MPETVGAGMGLQSDDLAVLDVSLMNLTPLALGDSDEVAVGDPVVAVGSRMVAVTSSGTRRPDGPGTGSGSRPGPPR